MVKITQSEFAQPLSQTDQTCGTLAPTQLAMLTASAFSGDPSLYVAAEACVFRNIEDKLKLRRAVCKTLDHFGLSSWQYDIESNSLTMGAAPKYSRSKPLMIDDCATVGAQGLENYLQALFQKEIGRDGLSTFDRALRSFIVSVSENSYACLILAHHALVDKESFGIIWEETERALINNVFLHDKNSFSKWKSRLSSPALSREMSANLLQLTSPFQGSDFGGLRFDLGKPILQGPPAHPRSYTISKDIVGFINAIANMNKVRPHAVWLAICSLALREIMSANKFLVNIPMTMRREPSDFSAVGCLISSIPLPIDVPDPNMDIGALARRLQDSTSYALERSIIDPSLLPAFFRKQVSQETAACPCIIVDESSGKVGDAKRRYRLNLKSLRSKFPLTININTGGATNEGSFYLTYGSGTDETEFKTVEMLLLRKFGSLGFKAGFEKVGSSCSKPADNETSDYLSLQHQLLVHTLLDVALQMFRFRPRANDEIMRLGLKSIDILHYISQVNKKLGTDLRARDLFRCSSFEKVARYILSTGSAAR